MADRFYCPDPPVDGHAWLEGDEARHLTKVRRVAPGESVEIFDGRGSAFLAKVTTVGRDRVELTILEPLVPTPAPGCSLTLATAVPKGERFDWLVEKATELGVTRLIPLITERSVVDPRSAKLDRLRRVIVEASKQCQRTRLMDLETPTRWASLVSKNRSSMRLIAHPGAPGMAATGLRPAGQSVILAIGAEGGFTSLEVEQAVAEGWQVVGMGPTLLRVETAALAGCSALMALGEIAEEGKGV